MKLTPFKMKSGQSIDGSYNKFQANPGNGAWSDFQALGGVMNGNSKPVAISNSDGRLEVFVIHATQNALYHRSQTSPSSSTWSSWEFLAGNVKADSNAAVARNSDGRLQVFFIDSDSALHHSSLTSPGSSTCSGWSSLGSSLSGSPAVIQNQDGRLEVFVVGAHAGSLFHNWQTSAGTINRP